jgi:hypothetical protein
MANSPGALASAYLLFQTGLNELSLGLVVFTCACTTISILLFGGRGGPRP